MTTKQESVSGATFKAWSFSSIFNFGCKDGQATTATCKCCLLLVCPSGKVLCKFQPLPIVAKNCEELTNGKIYKEIDVR